MAQFTPSSLTFQSLGSMNLTIGSVNANVISGTDQWVSGITDIRSVILQPWTGASLPTSSSGFSVSWTASTGTIWTIKDRTFSGSGLIMWVLSGGPSLTA